MLNEIGRLCVKLAGRDAGNKCVIVEIIDNNYVLIDGNTRRRKCNIAHLEPLETVLKIKDKASHEEVLKAFEAEKLEVKATSKPKQAKERPKKAHIARKKK